jgi:hypothetical protein
MSATSSAKHFETYNYKGPFFISTNAIAKEGNTTKDEMGHI